MYSNFGLVYAYLGNYQKNKYYFNKVFMYHEDSRSKAFIYTNIGDVEKLSGNREEALANYRKAENLYSSGDGTIRY